MAERLGADYIYTQLHINTGHDFREADVRIPTAVLAQRICFNAGLTTVSTVVDHQNYFDSPHDQCFQPLIHGVNPTVVNDIMQSVYPTSAVIDDNHSGVLFTDFVNTQNPFIYAPRERETHPFTERMSHYYRAAAPMYGIKASATLDNVIDTLIKRFGGTTTNKFDSPPKVAGNQLFQALIGNFDTITPITFEDVANAAGEQALRVKVKGDVANTTEYDPYLYTARKISVFNKAQVKAKASENSHLPLANGNLKAGQPISAQPKFMTHLGGAIMTALEKNIRRDMPPWMVMGYGLSKLELRAVVRNLDRPEYDECIECDITEMDSVRGAATNKYFMQRLYDLYGCDEMITRYAQALNDDWLADADEFKIAVRGFFHSGRFDTLGSNTIVNLAIACLAFEMKEPTLMIAMGDDLAIIARKVSVVKEYSFLKVKHVSIPEWTSELIADDVYPSIPKKVAKLLNRQFRDQAELEQYRIAVADWIHNYTSYSLMQRVIVVNAAKYAIPVVMVEQLFSFLHAFSLGKCMNDLRSPDFLKHNVTALPVNRQSWKYSINSK
nr:RdRp CDS [Astacus astacus]